MERNMGPVLQKEDDMSTLINIDYNSLINELLANRQKSPIVQSSDYASISSLLPSELPKESTPIGNVIQEVRSVIDYYCERTSHPGYFGYVTSSGSPVDALGHAMAACINQNVCAFKNAPGATAIERTVINWLIDLVGIPNNLSDGILLSGGSIANLTALTSALVSHLGPRYGQEGLLGLPGDVRPTIVCSSAAHFSIQKAARIMGIGSNNVITIDVNPEHQMDSAELEKSLKVNKHTFCVVATAGTTTVGAIDPLSKIAEICEKEKVWLHVDAAYGGGVLMSEELKHLLKGIELADSVTLDLHKWFYCGFGLSALLYRDKSAAEMLFYENSEYTKTNLNPYPEDHAFFHLSPELSRRFRALPAYITIRYYGTRQLGNNVLYNVQCAQYLADLLDNEPDLQLICRPQLSIVTFRYAPRRVDGKITDVLNSTICKNIKFEGNFLLSTTSINGRPVLRLAIVNCLTRSHHIKTFLEDVLRIGRQLLKAQTQWF